MKYYAKCNVKTLYRRAIYILSAFSALPIKTMDAQLAMLAGCWNTGILSFARGWYSTHKLGYTQRNCLGQVRGHFLCVLVCIALIVGFISNTSVTLLVIILNYHFLKKFQHASSVGVNDQFA